MLTSNLLFPYIRNRTASSKLSQLNPDFVCVVLGWSTSGSVIAIHTSSKTGRENFRTWQAEDLVKVNQWIPTTVRLRIFKDFDGGLCASNEQYFARLLSDHAPSCLKDLQHMVRYAYRAPLPRSLQQQQDELFALYEQQNRTFNAAQQQRYAELNNLSILMQTKNLTLTEVEVLQALLKMEAQAVQAARLIRTQGQHQVGVDLRQKTLDAAEKLFRSDMVDDRVNEAEQFENLALCQRPEYVPYMRSKLLRLHPEMSASDLERMDRSTLCRMLVNVPQLDQIDLPVYLYQIQNAPNDFVNEETGLLNLWDTTRYSELDHWLLKNYGVTIKQMQKWNDKFKNDTQTLYRQGRSLMSEKAKQQKEERQYQQKLAYFRLFLTTNRKCESLSENQCHSLQFPSIADGNFSLCDWKENQCHNMSVGIMKLMNLYLEIFCSPKVPLLVNDLQFILETFKNLKDYYILTKKKMPAEITHLDQKCQVVHTMFRQLRQDASRTNGSWRDVPANAFLENREVKDLVRRYFNDDLTSQAKSKLQLIWDQFRATNPNESQKVTFSFVVIVYTAAVNGILQLGK
jgi:hypothetical protein